MTSLASFSREAKINGSLYSTFFRETVYQTLLIKSTETQLLTEKSVEQVI